MSVHTWVGWLLFGAQYGKVGFLTSPQSPKYLLICSIVSCDMIPKACLVCNYSVSNHGKVSGSCDVAEFEEMISPKSALNT